MRVTATPPSFLETGDFGNQSKSGQVEKYVGVEKPIVKMVVKKADSAEQL